MWRFFLSFALFSFLGEVPAAAAQCDLRLEISNLEWRGGPRGGYDVFDPGEYPQTTQFRVHLIGDPCPFFVTFSRGVRGGQGRAATFASESLAYELYASVDQRSVLKELPEASIHDVLTGSFSSGETVRELSYTMIVPPLQVRPSGTYTDFIRVTVYQGTPNDFVERDSRTINLSIPVTDVAELSLVEQGGPFNQRAKARALDFGRLTRGKRSGVDLRVRSNIGYRLILESEHGGVMRNVDPSISATIPYSLRVGGAPIAFAPGAQVALARRSGMTGRDGEAHAVEMVIGDVAGALAGTYRDNITVTVIAEE